VHKYYTLWLAMGSKGELVMDLEKEKEEEVHDQTLAAG
jgi:hypothetical protein